MSDKTRLVDFLRGLGESKLADTLEGVVTTTPNRKVMALTEDISSALYSRIVRIRKPRGLMVMLFDSEQQEAQRALSRCDSVESLDIWCQSVVENTVRFYNKHAR